ncbi:MAG: hypothetical protein GWP05_04945, partial [Anaerolineaceae bacterium]|nr:hypothetical protein [Anaerolineaceae bacterium]
MTENNRKTDDGPGPWPVPVSVSPFSRIHRWTQVVAQRGNWRHALWHGIKIIALIYVFLCAINMMGKGIKTAASNPEYVSKFAGDPAFAAYKKEPGRVAGIAVLPAEVGGQALKGRKVGTIGRIDEYGGHVAVGDKAVRATTVSNIEAAHHSCVRIVEVLDDHVVVEPVRKHKDWLYGIFDYAKNPFLALLVGILITAAFQSSSFTTSFTVGMVATVSGFPIKLAIPIIMGANIGTSVTNIMVSLGYINRRDEFRRAFAGATVHDFFNVLTVAVLFALEQTTGVLHLLAGKMAGLVYHGGSAAISEKPTNFIKEAVKPAISAVKWMLSDLFGLGQNATGIVMTVLAIILLFAALLLLVKVLRGLVLKRAESFFDRVLFRNAPTAFVVGLVLTASVQSSSVTTSLVVPLIAAGLLTLRQVFPYLLGANIGTTVTALIAAFATSAATEEGAKIGLTLACVHLLFNVIGAIMFYPLRWIPIAMAQGLANRAADSKRYA